MMGINGLLVGCLVGGGIRVGNLIWICNRKVLKTSLLSVAKNYLLYCGGGVGSAVLLSQVMAINCRNFMEWICYAIPVTLIISLFVLATSILFSRKQLLNILKYICKKR